VHCSVGVVGDRAADGASLVRFEVRDTGIGIPEASRELLFQPFRQLDATITRRFGGTGLGLAIVKNLVTGMKGTLAFESREGVGSCFSVELPLQETEALPKDLTPPLVLASGVAVLVVEDNQYNRHLLAEILASWGQRAVLAEDGLQALRLMKLQRFDLILLDIRMPGMDGIEVARRVRKRERAVSAEPVAIIAVTADADAATREACLAVGINEVLAKPVIPEQLARAIAAHGGACIAVSSAQGVLLNEQTRHDFADHPERGSRFREMLMQDIEVELRTLGSALEKDDRSELSRVCHTLKGLCGHLAYREPADLASWLQMHAATAKLQQLRSVAEQLRGAMQSVKP
jgi:CheY-like chemotaxis protein